MGPRWRAPLLTVLRYVGCDDESHRSPLRRPAPILSGGDRARGRSGAARIRPEAHRRFAAAATAATATAAAVVAVGGGGGGGEAAKRRGGEARRLCTFHPSHREFLRRNRIAAAAIGVATTVDRLSVRVYERMFVRCKVRSKRRACDA